MLCITDSESMKKKQEGKKVPSEGNLSTEKRKAEDDIESAEKRKRKKNKCPTPRPACSWVHFSCLLMFNSMLQSGVYQGVQRFPS